MFEDITLNRRGFPFGSLKQIDAGVLNVRCTLPTHPTI
jgi:hypothetical protein